MVMVMKSFKEVNDINIFITYLKAEKEWEALQDKTQVFNTRKTKDVKSRGSHCGDVADISEKLVRGLSSDELASRRAYLLGLIHDLGHIPYGHSGESIADSMIANHSFTEEEIKNITEIRTLIFGEKYVANLDEKRKDSKYTKNICFEHNENSVLRYISLCKEFGYEVDQDIITGILAHSTSRYSNLPLELDQQAVRLADKLAYINYDVNDLFLSFGGTKEFDALRELYENPPFTDPMGNEIKITLSNGKSYTLFEFLTQLESYERIDLMIDESIREAKAHAMNKEEVFQNYGTVLTGCNDIAVKLAGVRKELDKKNITPERKAELEKEKLDLEIQLYKRSPILYAAYEIKDRSDEFIRTGKGLTYDMQVDRTTHALSAVGNPDLLNQYIYKSLATNFQEFLNKTKGLSLEEIRVKYSNSNLPEEFLEFYEGYLNFKKDQEEVILSIPGNDKGITYPEIYTILNYIGIHSNSELNELAASMGLQQKFEREVVPQIETLLSDETMYTKEKGVLTKQGRDERDAIVSEYGAKVILDYGLEEENLTPTTKEETKEKLIEAGFGIGGVIKGNNEFVETVVEVDDINKVQAFDQAKKKAEIDYIYVIKQQLELLNKEQIESVGMKK